MRSRSVLASLAGLLAACAVPAGEVPLDRRSVDLSGAWEFRMDPEDRGQAEGWFEPGVAFDRKIRVPGAWNAQGMAFGSETQLRAYEAQHLNGTNLLGAERESEKLFSVFPGPAWYRRTVEVPASWEGKIPWLVFDGVHRSADVWINGQFAGSHGSYLTPFRFDLSKWARPGQTATLVVRVDARRNKEVDPLLGCLDTLDFLYITWGGIHRPVRLEATGPRRIEQVFAIPHVADSSVEVQVEPAMPVELEVFDARGVRVARGASPLRIPQASLWSPQSPVLYTLRVTAPGQDAVTTRFGMRELRAQGAQFLLNGMPIFLRGYGDDCIFPNTIAPPVGPQEYRRRLEFARACGFNYVRHHSWMPPPEYLDVADELGIMVQPEFPIAYRWDLAATPRAKEVYLKEWREVIRLNRNHPSIVAWCMGNEEYDSFPEASSMYRIARETDPSRLVIDSDGCRFQHRDRATLDFLVVQFNEGGSIGFGDGKYSIPADVMKPVVCHEMGYFVTLQDLSQIDLFQGGLRPYWLLATRDLAVRQRVTAAYPKWLEASYRLQSACLKENIEAARRSRLGGMSVWLLQDYPNCAEGVADMFFRPKGLSAEAFRRFNGPTVLLLDSPGRSFRSGETRELKILVSRFEDPPDDQARLSWSLRDGDRELKSGAKGGIRVSDTGVQELETLSIRMPTIPDARKLTLRVELEGRTTVENAWNLWVFPERSEAPTPPELLVASRLDAATLDRLEKGQRVLLLDPEGVFPTEKTNYRLSSWDGGGPSGTVIDPAHPALRQMPHEGWADLQFYPIIQGSKTVFLDPLPVRLEPIVRCIDRPNRLAHRAYLFEATVGRGKLLVSGFNLSRSEPATDFLRAELKRYASGPEFAPSGEIPVQWLRERLKP